MIVNRYRTEFGLGIIFIIFIVISELLNFNFGHTVSQNSLKLFTTMAGPLLCIFALLGLLDVWIPQEWIRKHIGTNSGIKGTVYVILLAMFQGGPLYSAFPTSHLLWKKGCSTKNVFIYLGAFSSLKVPMLFFEVNFLGWKFALIRAAVALPVFILIAHLMAAISVRQNSGMKDFVLNKNNNVN